MTFEKNQVESRERVKCISGIEGMYTQLLMILI